MTAHLAQTLASLHALLTAEGYLDHAQGVREAQEALHRSPGAVCARLASNAFWGGPGAISDIGFSKDWFPASAPGETVTALRERSDETVDAANHRLAELIVDLAADFSATCEQRVDPSWIERASDLGGMYETAIENGIR